ncbi:Ig-like domain repeat protein [Terriglobus sp. 2YAB30_2]|uniref:Ig-like domain repeat protein n=1 Tax=Terriglobus sp. 2YAB30_2 TaxID=3233023 RepID=UPI003F9EA2B5
MVVKIQAFLRSCAVVCMLACTLLSAAMAQQARRALPSVTTSLPAGAVVLDAAPASSPLQHISIALQIDDSRQNALAQYLTDLTTKGSTNYHHWLTPQEFAARFGATDAEIGAATAWLEAQGIHVTAANAAHTLLQAASTVAIAQQTFSADLHQIEIGGSLHVVERGNLSLPGDAPQSIRAVTGLDDLDDSPLPVAEASVDANSSAVLVLNSLSAGQADWDLLVQQANAQGITVLGNSSGDYAGMTVVVPAALSDVMMGTETRPSWQVAEGLPANGLRAVPDFISMADFGATVNELIARSGGRLGNINATLYQLAAIPGVYTQPAGIATGTWTALTGLGTVNPEEILKRWPLGTSTSNTSITSSNFAPTHGQSFTLTATVTSASGGATPTGTVTFSSSATGTPGTASLDSSGKATYSTKQLAGGSYSFNAAYAGDGTYASSNTPAPATISIQPESASVSAILNGTATYGANASIVVSVTGTSGVDNPTGTVSAQGQGTTDTKAYPATLAAAGSGTTKSTATITYPVSEKNTFTVLISCTSGDSNFTCPTPYTLSITPGATRTTSVTTLSSSPNPPVTGAATTFTATVASGSSSVTTVPTGSVDFKDNGTIIGSGTLSSGSATFATTLAAGSVHVITAVYSGDTVYNTSTSGSLSTSAGSTSSTVALTSNPSPPVAGKSVTFTATVTSTTSGQSVGRVHPQAAATPTGTVDFRDNGTSMGTSTVTSGAATYTTTLTAGTAHSITAVYSGNGTYAASTSSAISVQAATGTTATTTSLVASSYAVNGGVNITFTSTVKSSTSSTSTPTGTVTLTSSKDGVIGSGTIGTDGTVNISNSSLTIGRHDITATYSGDSTFATSSSSSIAVTISPSSGTLSASVSPSPGAYGNNATITVTVAVTTGAANGTVQAVVNGQTYTGTVTSGTGNLTITIPPPGKYSIVISCPSVNTFVCTNSPLTLSYTATKGNTTTTVTSSSSSANAGDSVTLTATVANAGNATGTYVYTGTVTFLDGTKTVGTAPLVAGSATATVTLTGAGTHSITAVYSGDTNWNGSTSTAIGVVTSKVASTLVLSASSTTAVNGTNIVFTATASGGSTTLSPPTGTVTFYDTVGSTVVTLGTATLTANGTTQSVASVSSTGLLPGAHSLYAIYAGDTNYKSATSNTLAVTISDFTVTLNPTSLNITQGKSAQVAATVTSSGGFAGTITLGCTPPAAAQMTCAFSPTSLGSSGTSTLTIKTNANTASLERHDIPWHLPVGGTVVAAIMWFMVPTRRRISLLIAILAVLVTMTAGGCASGVVQNGTDSSSGGSANNGTPFGTQLLTITVSGTDGGSPVRHNYSYQVTVQ